VCIQELILQTHLLRSLYSALWTKWQCTLNSNLQYLLYLKYITHISLFSSFQAGSYIFGTFIRRPALPFLEQCDRSADEDSNIPMPDTAHQPVSFFKKRLLKDTTPALTQPDYERALFINKILQLLWPHLSPAIHKEVMKQAKAPVDEILTKVPLVKDLRIDKLDLGERPFRIDSFKTYKTFSDEIIVETPLFWGGDMAVRATAVIKAGPLKIDLPVDVSNFQFKALARITIPMVETLPCLGGVTISLLEEPWIDFDLNIVDMADIMALPGVPLAVRTAIKLVAGKMLVYPNEFSVPLMPGFGLPPPPQGMLKVCVVSGHDLKSSLMDTVDSFVTLEVREGRPAQTTTIPNNINPIWGEDLDLVVDDPLTQVLKLAVWDDDLINPDSVGGAYIELNGAEFINTPLKPVTLRLPVYQLNADGDFPHANAEDLLVARNTAATDAAVAAAVAALPQKRTLLGKLRRKKEAKKLAATMGAATATSSDLPSGITTPRNTAAATHVSGTPTSSGAMRHSSPRSDDGSESTVDGEMSSRKRPPPGTVTGSITLEITYLPFKSSAPPPAPEAAAAAAAGGTNVPSASPGASPAAAAAVAPAPGTPAAAAAAGAAATTPGTPPAATSPPPVINIRRTLNDQSFAEPSSEQKGVLTVNLKKVMHLASAVDSFVQLRLYDPHRMPVPDIRTKTKVELHEASPRFAFKNDFVNISAQSVLTLTVCQQPGTMAALTSLRVPFLQKAAPKVLGRVRVPLDEVVREGRVNGVFALQEAQTGEMHLSLEWSGVDLGAVAEEAAVDAVASADNAVAKAKADQATAVAK
jgi:C2 domain/Synaptotagmin-like mitochondrial-lipid-binding domain